MRNRIPPDAFEYYHGLGPGRTYAAVAAHYGVSLRGVTKCAVKQDWRGRLARIEADARRKQDEKATEDVAAVDERHLKMSRAIQARALEALKTMPIHSGMSAVRALDVAIKIERAILGRNTVEAKAGPTLEELIAASWTVPPLEPPSAAAPAVAPMPPPVPVPAPFGSVALPLAEN
jgi:hypothetical protein